MDKQLRAAVRWPNNAKVIRATKREPSVAAKKKKAKKIVKKAKKITKKAKTAVMAAADAVVAEVKKVTKKKKKKK
jgi:hypothetical protein